MAPERAIAGTSGLQLRRRLARLGETRGIFCAGRRTGRIELFELVHRYRRLVGIGPLVVRVEIDGRQAAMSDLADQLSHLQTPVAEMDVADHIPSVHPEEPLQRVTNNGGAQV